MSIETKKVDLISWIASIQNKRLIEKLEKFRDSEDSWWSNLPKSVQSEIIESEKQSNNSDLLSHNYRIKRTQ
ncbi:MAG: hypothetical protein WCK02_17905 [Bacteroidota bacterium]